MRSFVRLMLQAGAAFGLWWFVTHVLVPNTGIAGTLVWLGACFALAFWMDYALPWRYGVAFTALALANFAVLFFFLKLAGNYGLLWLVPFLWFGYKLANVIDNRTLSHETTRPVAEERGTIARRAPG